MRREHVLPTPADTRALGAALAGVVRAGDLVVLVGPLGAGKTALTQGIGEALGVREPVTSPTFVIARVHRGGTEVALTVSGSVARPGAYLTSLDFKSRSWFVGASVLQPLVRRRAASLWAEGE